MDAGTTDTGDELRVEQRPARRVGRTIAEAREAKGLSQADLAQSLNLDLRIVEVIEADDFDAAPEPIYVRAYLKSWAGLLGLDAGSLIRDFDLSLGEEPEEGSIPRNRSSNKKLEVMSGPATPSRAGGGKFWTWLIWLVLLAIAALLVAQFLPERLQGWLGKNSTGTSTQTVVPLERQVPKKKAAPATQSSASIPPPPGMQQSVSGGQDDASLPTKPLAALPGSASAGTTFDQTPPVGPSPQASAAQQGDQAASAAGNTAKTESASPSALPTDNLVIKAKGADCWVEVKNAAGTRLMYDVLKAGSERRFGGDGPFSVVLGNPQAVQVLWKDKPVKLGSGNASTGVVRVKVGGS